MTSRRFKLHHIAIALTLVLCGTTTNGAPNGGQPSDGNTLIDDDDDVESCVMYNYIGKNELTPIDVVVKNADSNIACIKARFSLAIKVEELVPAGGAKTGGHHAAGQDAPTPTSRSSVDDTPEELRVVLGYLPLEQVVAVEHSCPDVNGPQPGGAAPDGAQEATLTNDNAELRNSQQRDNGTEQATDEIEMILTFACGKLAFTFTRNQTCAYLSSIKGLVKLDMNVVREFIVEQPMLITSDLTHHFKYDDLIEVGSQAITKTYILSANLYFTEIETFRNTTSRDFIRPPDERSRPFLDDEPPA